MSNFLKTAVAFLLSVVLLYVGFKYFLTDEQRKLFFAIPLHTHIISILLAIPGYLIGGIELRFLYSRISKIKLSVYDTATLPFVINLWGFVLPFQGSFIYTTAYVLSKYKKGISDSVKVYLLSFSISMCLAGLIGILYSLYSDFHFSIVYYGICFLLFINPLLLYIAGRLFNMFNERNAKFLKLLMEKAARFFVPGQIDKQLISILLLIKIANILLAGVWLYWITIALNINLSLIQLILIILLMNITMLIRITPGNLGLNQFASGGIAVLVGGTMNDGFLLSAFQYLTNIIIALTFGTVFSIFNAKYFSWQALKSVMKKN